MPKQLTPEEQKLWNNAMLSTTPLNQNRIQSDLPRRPVRIKPNHYFHTTLDLHGKTVQEAYDLVKDQLARANLNKQKHLTIITGKSGTISQEFCHWISKFESNWRVSVSENKAVWKFKKRR